MKEALQITASAEDNGKTTVKGIAYSGGKMNLAGWHLPVVVDASGLVIPDEIPLLANHVNDTSARVGIAKATAVDGHVELEGEIVATGDLAENIISQAKAGAAWQLSIGAEVSAAELVEDEKRTINGIEHEAPFYHVTAATLREISIVAVGADKDTSLSIAASMTPVGESIAEPLKASSQNWQARYKGASRKINELQATCDAYSSHIKTLQCQLDEASTALASSKAECEQLKAQLDESAKNLQAKDKDLASTRDSLAKVQSEITHLQQTRQLLTAGVLSSEAPSFDQRIAAARSPEEREAIRAEKKAAR